jgi:hypothetical protein
VHFFSVIPPFSKGTFGLVTDKVGVNT